MRSRWPILAILCVLASMLVPGIASASTAAGAETRVWAFDLQDQACIGVERSLTLELHPECAPTYDRLASDSLLAARGGVRFAQRGVSSTFRYGEFAGRTIDVVAAGLRSGAINPSQRPIQTITRDGVTYTLKNRSLMALRQAGMEPAVIRDVTGNAFFEGQLTQRLGEFGGQVGADFVPIIRGGN